MVLGSEIGKVFSILEKTHQSTMLELLGAERYTPFQLLVATLLSARSKDSTVIPLVKKMFAQYPLPEDYISLDLRTLENMIYGIGFFRVKARNVKKLSGILREKYNGKVPGTLEELTSLPGVGRKTANCILNYVFHKPAIAVDIHVYRISNRLGWVETTTPEMTEESLQNILPQRLWSEVNRLLVDHGQRVCLPRNPKCSSCAIWKYCKFGKKKLGLS